MSIKSEIIRRLKAKKKEFIMEHRQKRAALKLIKKREKAAYYEALEKERLKQAAQKAAADAQKKYERRSIKDLDTRLQARITRSPLAASNDNRARELLLGGHSRNPFIDEPKKEKKREGKTIVIKL